MKSIAQKLARLSVRDMQPYRAIRQDLQDSADYLLLETSENPWSPLDWPQPLNRYPDKQSPALRQALANLYGVSSEQCLITRGSDEGIELLIRAFCEPKEDAIAICPPTFGIYKMFAGLHSVRAHEVPRQGEFLNHIDVETLSRQDAKIFFICSPCNPTSTAVEPQQILDLCTALQDKALVVCDEVYIEFSKISSVVPHISAYPNLVVLRSLSKSYGLAGLRCGSVLAGPEVIQCLERVQTPYPMPQPTIDLALQALQPAALEAMKEKQTLIKTERDRLIENLKLLPWIKKVFPSQANFIFLQAPHAPRVVEYLRQNKILVRDRSAQIPDGINISVGSPEQNAKLLATLGRFKGVSS